ncbi:leucyl aminopeptidase [Candidatus Woesearchaeota archaeon]|nr:leucyl aminopeptidase [Candidatus Woesearchaeota archaeon]
MTPGDRPRGTPQEGEKRMRIHTTKTGKESLIAVPVTEGFDTKQFSKKTQHYLATKQFFKGKRSTQLLMQGKPDVLFIGIGEQPAPDSIRKAAGTAAKHARDHRCEEFAFDLRPIKQDHVQEAVEGALLGLYTYHEYKKRQKDDPKDPTAMTIICTEEKEARKLIKQGKTISEGVLLVRDLVNRPASDKTPEAVAKLAQALGKRYGLNVRVLGKKDLEQLGMRGLLSVARGSDKEPKIVILELNAKAKEPLTALIGKGVTFDAGGLQIKPDPGIRDMKMDMAGAATVLGTMVSLARLKHPGRVVGAMGLVENLVGPDAYKPGDILTSYNGKTVEVEHTDAEGRLVLADMLGYIEETYKPAKMIDLATLTGATLLGLGTRVAALLGNDDELIKDVEHASAATDELVWRLPLRNHYKELMKGSISDLSNIGKKPSPFGGPGTITAAAFLSEFVTDKTAWAHLDIAGTAFSYEETDYVPKGGTGWGVRLLTSMLTQTSNR